MVRHFQRSVLSCINRPFRRSVLFPNREGVEASLKYMIGVTMRTSRRDLSVGVRSPKLVSLSRRISHRSRTGERAPPRLEAAARATPRNDDVLHAYAGIFRCLGQLLNA